jgi:hypothetical protein
MSKATKRQVKNNEIYQHKKTDDFMVVQDAQKMNRGWLYTLKSVTTSEPEYKRCYEDEFKEKYSRVKNNKAVKVLYGKK